MERYRDGEELDEADHDVLRPSCDSQIRHEESEERKEALQELPTLPKTMKGWEQYAERTDGEYAYVTYRQKLPEPTRAPQIRKRIKEAVGRVLEPSFPRSQLIPTWRSMTPIEPRAGPG